MSSKKTADKLVASIRKSKTGTVASKTSQRSDSATSTTKSAAEAKTMAAKSSSQATAKKSVPSPGRDEIRDREDVIRGSFSRRRVWPD